MKKRRVVVTGLGVISPLGNVPKVLFENLLAGKSAVDKLTSFDTTDFEVKIAAEVKDFDFLSYINKKDARKMDRFCQFAVAASLYAKEDAKLDLNKIDSKRVGVYVGSGIGGMNTLCDQFKILLKKGPQKISPFFVPMLISNMASGWISILLNLKGPSFSTVSACATGAHNIGEAFRLIRDGYTDVMFAGGAEAAIVPLAVAGFSSLGALSKRNEEPQKASRPFDKKRDGFVMGEGAALLVLEAFDHAMKRGADIYAEICGYAATSDAYHITSPDMDSQSAANCMALALQDANFSIFDIEYINAHGTSTFLNDICETLAIKKVFKEYAYKLAISSTKSMIGHLLGAAGSIEALVTVLTLKEQIIHPTINYEYKDEECDLDYVPNKPRSININAALSNSFGFGGHNATIVFKRFED